MQLLYVYSTLRRVLARDSGEYFSFVQLVFSHMNFSVAECFHTLVEMFDITGLSNVYI